MPRLGIAALLMLAAGTLLGGCGGTVTSSSATSSPQMTLSASSLTFGNTAVGFSSQQAIEVTNTGSGLLTISSLATTGDFAQTSSGCSGLAAGQTCTVTIFFNPTALGTRTGTLTVTGNATPGTQTATLTGTGVVPFPQLTLSYSAITFPTLTVGQSSAPFLLTASSTGTSPVTVSISLTGADYTQTSSACPATLAVGASCQIYLVFKPSATGTRTGALVATNNTSVNPQTVTLNGTGVAAAPYTSSSSFQVTVLAGSKPISAAAVQFYAAGTSGNGSAPTALSAATTNASGVATIPSGFACPAASSPVYVVSRGGTVSGATAANPNIALLGALGPCNGIAAGAKYIVDEATTVAGIEALQQFYSPGGNIGATASNLTGIANAFATAATLADPVAGTSPGATLPAVVPLPTLQPPVVSPAPRVNSLANILNACVASSSVCASLYTATTQNSVVPANTLDAAFYLARNPAANVSALFALSQASSAYSPALSAAPHDWTMFLEFNGGAMNNPSGLGVDSTGSVWVASYFSIASKFSPIGAAIFPGGLTGSGLNNSYGLAIDTSDNPWIPNEQPFTASGIGSVTEFNSAGTTALSGAAGYQSGGMDYPLSVAIDPNGTVWVVDYGNSHITLLNPSGVPLSGTSGYTTNLFAFPVAVAVDANHFGWIVNQSSNNVTKAAPDGSSFTNFSCCNLASGIAIDQGDNVWVADYFGDEVSLLTNSGTVISSNYTAGGSISHPQAIAIDGAGTAWVGNYRAAYLSALAGSASKSPGASLSPTVGVGADAALLEAYAIAIDASGNIWVSNQGNNTVTKFIGLAVPVRTPLSGLPQLP